jgi:ribonuclease P protein component
VVLVAAGQAGKPRLGLTVSRRVGSAVVRSRVKRYVREWFRCKRALLDELDVVVIARPGAGKLRADEVWRELTSVCEALPGSHAASSGPRRPS